MTEAMKITLSNQPADARWGEKATYSINNDGITLHLTGNDDLGLIQRAARKIDGLGIKHVSLAGEGWDTDRSWAFWAGYKGPKGTRKIEWANLDEAGQKELESRLNIIDWVRDTINAPAEELGPEQLAQRAVDLLCGVAGDKMSYRITKGEDLREQNYMGIHTVGRGSERPPVLLALDYNPTGDKDAPVFACLVGKGITFDTGGLWLKEGAGMYTMKYDMCGAANVLGLMLAVAELGLPVRIMGVLALAENAIGPDAMQPGTVARACNGTTVEINNTDAEGRLVLADAIAWASLRHPRARYIIDMATLTGAVVKALGYELSGLMTQDEPLRKALTKAGKQSGDEVWSLPLDARLKKQTDSAIADLCNTPTNNAAISASAAWLLHHFCPPTIPWAHLDISGTALWRENGRSVASGRPIPLLVEHLLGDL